MLDRQAILSELYKDQGKLPNSCQFDQRQCKINTLLRWIPWVCYFVVMDGQNKNPKIQNISTSYSKVIYASSIETQ